MAKNTKKQTIEDAALAGRRAEVRGLIEASGRTATELSRAIGRSKEYLSDYLAGRKSSISAVDMDALRAEASGEAPQRQRAASKKAGGLPVYAAAEGGQGSIVISSDPVDYVARPWFLEHVADSYAVLIVGESMSPAYEPGDMALVNPRLPAIRGKDAIFIASEDDGDFRAAIKRFVRATDTEYIAEQFNPTREVRLPKKEWKKALRIVGRFSGS